jgi:hypothetical protein
VLPVYLEVVDIALRGTVCCPVTGRPAPCTSSEKAYPDLRFRLEEDLAFPSLLVGRRTINERDSIFLSLYDVRM